MSKAPKFSERFRCPPTRGIRLLLQPILAVKLSRSRQRTSSSCSKGQLEVECCSQRGGGYEQRLASSARLPSRTVTFNYSVDHYQRRCKREHG